MSPFPLIKLVQYFFGILPNCIAFSDCNAEVGKVVFLKEMDYQDDTRNFIFCISTCSSLYLLETLNLSLNFHFLPTQYQSFCFCLSPFQFVSFPLFFSLSFPCDEFVSLMPTVSAIINHMELHLLHTHIQTHKHTVGPGSQVPDYEVPSVSPPSLAVQCMTVLVSVQRICRWCVSMTLTWNPLYRRRYSRWQHPHTPLRVDTYSPDSHYSPAHSVGRHNPVNTRT